MRPLRHARDLHREALHHLSRHLRGGEAEDLHQFRVRLKQLKALLSATARPGTAWRPYRDLYRLSSPVRDADVNGRAPEDTPECRRLRRATRTFVRAHALLPGCTADELKPLRKPDVAERAVRDLQKIRRCLTRIPPAREWHDMRKLCKRILHNGRYAGWQKNPDDKGLGPALLRRLAEAAEAIGHWHDSFFQGGQGASKKAGDRSRAALRRLTGQLNKSCGHRTS